MFELESLPDLLKLCGLVYPRQEDQYAQLLQDILVTKSDILPHSQEVRTQNLKGETNLTRGNYIQKLS